MISYEVGDGSTIFLWHDRWHPNGVLSQVYGHKIVYEVASFLNAKVSNVLQDKEWCWCPTRSEEMVDIQIKMSLNPITHSDRVVWSLTVAGTFSCATTWQHLRKKHRFKFPGGS